MSLSSSAKQILLDLDAGGKDTPPST